MLTTSKKINSPLKNCNLPPEAVVAVTGIDDDGPLPLSLLPFPVVCLLPLVPLVPPELVGLVVAEVLPSCCCCGPSAIGDDADDDDEAGDD